MLYYHCALLCEAKPIIDALRLKATVHRPFKLYQNDDVCLIVSGIGKTATAAAVSYAYVKTNEPTDAIWINVGIAGSSQHATGEIILASKITDADTKQNWYPPFLLDVEIARNQVTTYSQPQSDYTQPGLYDMEVSAFVSIAQRFTTSEWVQSIKIISDTHADEAKNLSEERATQLVASQYSMIAEIAEQLKTQNQLWHDAIAMPEEMTAYLVAWRFTATEREQLKRLMQRARALSIKLPAAALLAQLSKSQMFESLQAQIAATPVEFFEQ